MSITKNDKSLYAWALLRLGLGFTFLWAFVDKLVGLGFATCRDKTSDVINTYCSSAWASGGSPTDGFLSHAVTGPLANFYHNLAGKGLVDWLFMIGLLVIGVGLLFGVWVRFAAVAGALMLLLMWSALLLPANNPFIDEHIIYVFALLGIYLTADQQKWSLSGWWSKSQVAKTLPFLK